LIEIQHTPDGLVVRSRPDGVGRIGGALFLAIWLCFWLVGETVVLGVLVSGASVLLTGHELSGAPRMIELLPALGVGGFMLVWITFWTFGGVMALLELLRLISSEEKLLVGPDALTIGHRRGPFSWTSTVKRADVRNVRVSPRTRMLVLDAGRRSYDVAQVRTPADERAAVFAVRKELGLDGAREGEPVLPEGWEETITPEGDRVIVRDPRARKKQALVLAVIAMILWAIALANAWTALSRPSALPGAIGLTVLAALAAAGAYWLEASRQEFKIGGQRVVVRRRWRGTVRELLVADRLELVRSTDSDGDIWYKLEAVNTGAPKARKVRRTLASAMNDPFPPTALGRRLAARAGVPYTEN
jgi:hypothetical protein